MLSQESFQAKVLLPFGVSVQKPLPRRSLLGLGSLLLRGIRAVHLPGFHQKISAAIAGKMTLLVCCSERGTASSGLQLACCSSSRPYLRFPDCQAGSSRRASAELPPHATIICATNDITGRRNYRSKTRERLPNKQLPQHQFETARNDGLEISPGYRRNVGICIVNREGLIFAAR